MPKKKRKEDAALSKLRADITLAAFRERVLWSKVVRALNRLSKQRKLMDRINRKLRDRVQELGLLDSFDEPAGASKADKPSTAAGGPGNGE